MHRNAPGAPYFMRTSAELARVTRAYAVMARLSPEDRAAVIDEACDRASAALDRGQGRAGIRAELEALGRGEDAPRWSVR